MAHRCAILDDYQNVALKLADWSIPDVEVKVFNDPSMKKYLRITVGTPDENRILLSAFRESL